MTRSSRHGGRFALCAAVTLLTMLALACVASAALADGPVTWIPTGSTYGSGLTGFLDAPAPAPAGTGMTQLGSGMAYGSGFWQPDSEVFAFGFLNQIPTSASLPAMAQTDLSSTVLVAGTPLSLMFHKDAGQRINYVAMVGDPNAAVSIDYTGFASLTDAVTFTVRATVVDPVASAGGNVGATFGLIIDCAASDARNYYGSLFLTNLHWLDIDPPTFTSTGLAGLSANGANGAEATFDGILAPSLLTAMGIADPAQVQGYVDVTAVTGWTGATFAVLGAGDGSLWPVGFWKYRITNSTWSTHNIMYGRLAKPTKATGTSPKGTISGTKPTFKWRKLGTAATYEVRVYKGAKLLLKKTGCKTLSWKASKALPKGVNLTWKVRGKNGAGNGSFCTALKFKIK